jgi:hypothetical protein
MEDDTLRATALKLACERDRFYRHDLPPKFIIEVAETFYQFLKGETK